METAKLTKEVNGFKVYDKASVLGHNENVMRSFNGQPNFPRNEAGSLIHNDFNKSVKCGVPVYEGNTYPVRESLKDAGFVFNNVFNMWHPKGTVLATLWP